MNTLTRKLLFPTFVFAITTVTGLAEGLPVGGAGLTPSLNAGDSLQVVSEVTLSSLSSAASFEISNSDSASRGGKKSDASVSMFTPSTGKILTLEASHVTGAQTSTPAASTDGFNSVVDGAAPVDGTADVTGETTTTVNQTDPVAVASAIGSSADTDPGAPTSAPLGVSTSSSSPVPEPSSLMLVGSMLLGIEALRRKRAARC